MRRRLLLAPIVLLGSIVLAACGNGGDEGAASTTNPTAATGRSAAQVKPLEGKNLDRAFIMGMSAHHQAAMDMARVELEKGTNAEVKALAQKIVTAQQQEIADLKRIAEARFDFTPETTMSGPMGVMMGVPMSSDPSKMADELRSMPDTDRSFMEMMIPHHANAIAMADEERRNGGDSELKTMAEKVIADQAEEIGEMQRLLAAGA